MLHIAHWTVNTFDFNYIQFCLVLPLPLPWIHDMLLQNGFDQQQEHSTLFKNLLSLHNRTINLLRSIKNRFIRKIDDIDIKRKILFAPFEWKEEPTEKWIKKKKKNRNDPTIWWLCKLCFLSIKWFQIDLADFKHTNR